MRIIGFLDKLKKKIEKAFKDKEILQLTVRVFWEIFCNIIYSKVMNSRFNIIRQLIKAEN